MGAFPWDVRGPTSSEDATPVLPPPLLQHFRSHEDLVTYARDQRVEGVWLGLDGPDGFAWSGGALTTLLAEPPTDPPWAMAVTPSALLELRREIDRVRSGCGPVVCRVERALPGAVTRLDWHARPAEAGGVLVALVRVEEEVAGDAAGREFVRLAAHDLQEPLRAISGCAQILARTRGEALDDQGRVLLGHVVDGATRMKTLLDDLHGYIRLASEEGRQETVDLTDAARTALVRLRVDPDDARFHLGALPTIHGDRERWVRVFQELFDNSLQYRGEAAPSVQVDYDAETGEVTIVDDGAGVPSAFLEQVFAPLRRLHSREVHPGTGMGLAVCRRIVEAHGGRVWLDPDPAGPGACVRIRLGAPRG